MKVGGFIKKSFFMESKKLLIKQIHFSDLILFSIDYF
jgi:hypothetical protein